jgi:hypothetical protein
MRSPRTEGRHGWEKGVYRTYIRGHNRRSSVEEFVEDSDTHCWLWQRKTGRQGYGVFYDGRKATSAHRIYYMNLIGPIPDGMVLDHLCRNKACVNPGHLEPVSPAENIRRGASRLTWDDVRRMRALRAEGLTGNAIADEYNMSRAAVYRILSNQTWKEPTDFEVLNGFARREPLEVCW